MKRKNLYAVGLIAALAGCGGGMADDPSVSTSPRLLATTTVSTATTSFRDPALTAEQYNVTLLYLTGLNRAPDKPGLDYYTNLLTTKAKTFPQIANEIFGSTESRTVYASNLNWPDLITKFYQVMLNRTPGRSELNYWVGRLATEKNRSTIALAIAGDTLQLKDGAPGKSYLVNRFLSAQYIAKVQEANNTSFDYNSLQSLLAPANATTGSVQLVKNGCAELLYSCASCWTNGGPVL